MTTVREPDYIPEGTVIECSCGATVSDFQSWKTHQEDHDGEASWDLVDAHTGQDIA